MTNKYCHAELDSASTLDIVHGFRTLRNKLFGQPFFLYGYLSVSAENQDIFCLNHKVIPCLYRC
jgi:hypothetical protein